MKTEKKKRKKEKKNCKKQKGDITLEKQTKEKHRTMEEKANLIGNIVKTKNGVRVTITAHYKTANITIEDKDGQKIELTKIDVDEEGCLVAQANVEEKMDVMIKIRGIDIYCVQGDEEKQIEEQMLMKDIEFLKTHMTILSIACLREKSGKENEWLNKHKKETMLKKIEQKKIEFFLDSVEKITEKSYEQFEKEKDYYKESIAGEELCLLKVEKGEDGINYYMLKDTTGIYQKLPTLKNVKNMVKEPVTGNGKEYRTQKGKTDQEKFAYIIEYLLVHIELNQLRNEGFEVLGDEILEEEFRENWYKEIVKEMIETKNIYNIVEKLRKLNKEIKAEILGIPIDSLVKLEEKRKEEKKKRKEKL